MSDFETEFKIETLDEIQDNLNSYHDIQEKLENGHDFDQVFDELFRLVHNIKGNSKSAGFDSFSAIVHELESKLISYKDNEVPFSDKFIGVLGSCLSIFQDAVEKLKEDLNCKISFTSLEQEILALTNDSPEEGISELLPAGAYKFLIVDDDVEMTELLEEYLSDDFNCHVTRVFDGEKAFEVCTSQSFDIIITDNNMPKMDGQVFIKTLRESSSFNNKTPIIFASGFRPDLIPLSEMWEDVFILDKPMDPNQLKFLIKCSIKSKKAA